MEENHRNLNSQSSHPDGEPAEIEGFQALPVPDTEPPYDPEPDPEPGVEPAEEDPLPEREYVVPPRVFALCVDGYDPGDYADPYALDPELVAGWGMTEEDGRTLVRLAGSNVLARCGSPEGARRLLRHHFGDLRLIWL